MTTHESGSAVRSGYYLNASTWSIEPVASDGDRLPAGRGRWTRVPAAAALVLVPVLGAAFLLFLPLAGVLVTLDALASSVVSLFRASATDLAATVSPGWRPGEAHFTGKLPRRAVEEEPPAEDALEVLAREIAARRAAR